MLESTETEWKITFIYQVPISAESASSSIHILIVSCGSCAGAIPSVHLQLMSRLFFFFCFFFGGCTEVASVVRYLQANIFALV